MSFVQQQVAAYFQAPAQKSPTQVVAEFEEYFKGLYDHDIASGKTRKLSYLASTQVSLSNFKKELATRGAPMAFLKGLHLSADKAKALRKEKSRNMRQGAIYIPKLQGDAVIRDARRALKSPDPLVRVIALAALTGRRVAEILMTARFDPPREVHYTNEAYWTCISGLVKQSKDVQPICRDIPLLAKRSRLLPVLADIRQQLGPFQSIKEVNTRYGKPLARKLSKFCPEIQRLHQFRKFYALVTFHYFNESGCSLPRLASDYLGHRMMSESILTYLSARVDGLGSLNFGVGSRKRMTRAAPPPPSAAQNISRRHSSTPRSVSVSGHSSRSQSRI